MLNWKAFKSLLSAAVFAGLLAGLLLTGVQKIQVSPLILQAEVYEDAAAEAAQHEADHHDVADASHHHEHDHAWQPENGWERTLYTAAANISLAVGLGLLLGAAISQRDNTDWRSGLLWGLAGYGVFFIAPSLGLPPEVPGTEAAPLADRQLWWLLTVVSSAGGLSLLVFARDWKLKFVGIATLALPHLIGAPHPQAAHSAAPRDLAVAFVFATAIANAIFWLALGGLMGFFYKKPA